MSPSSLLGHTTETGPYESAVKHEIDLNTGNWSTKKITVSLDKQPFREGTFRYVFRLTDHSTFKRTRDCVAKVAKNANEKRDAYFREAEMQVQCKKLASEFNRMAGTRFDFLVPWVVEFPNRRKPSGECLTMLVEPYLTGEYVKKSNNYGYVLDGADHTVHAFSHFTWCHTNGKLLVCDLQGVGDMFTDPQIHSNEGNNVFLYGQGDMGKDGIQQFFNTHRCGPCCRSMRLTPYSREQEMAYNQTRRKSTDSNAYMNDYSPYGSRSTTPSSRFSSDRALTPRYRRSSRHSRPTTPRGDIFEGYYDSRKPIYEPKSSITQMYDYTPRSSGHFSAREYIRARPGGYSSYLPSRVVL